jgi:RNA polymerase sigma factor (sigma-70 family)
VARRLKRRRTGSRQLRDPTLETGDSKAFPPELTALLQAGDADARARTWSAFTGAYSDLILRAVHALGRDHDARMDLYAHALEELARNDFQRLRSYPPRGAGKFPYWLALVIRRLSLDRLRHLYGRSPGEGGVPDLDRQNRRRLVDLVGENLEIERLQDASGNPETELRRRQLQAALASALESIDSRDLLLLKLRFEDDLPAREVATLLGFPTVFHVYRRQNAVLESLRGALRARGFEGAQP